MIEAQRGARSNASNAPSLSNTPDDNVIMHVGARTSSSAVLLRATADVRPATAGPRPTGVHRTNFPLFRMARTAAMPDLLFRRITITGTLDRAATDQTMSGLLRRRAAAGKRRQPVKRPKLLHLIILPVTSGPGDAARRRRGGCSGNGIHLRRNRGKVSGYRASARERFAGDGNVDGCACVRAVATTQTRNAVQSVAGRLNWVAPGLGTAIDLVADKAADAATLTREAQIANERATVTPTFEQAAQRLAELGRLAQDRDCAAKP